MSKYFVFLAFFVLCGFSVQDSTDFGQPKDERKIQNNLPKSNDPIWSILDKTKLSLNKEEWIYSAKFPDEVMELQGKEITVGGFILPLEPTEKFKHFILSKRTPTCQFCPPGEPNEIIEVFMETPISWDEDMIKISGKFKIVEISDKGMFFKLESANKL